MLVFHIDERTRMFRGRSSSVPLPPSRRRAHRRAVRASVPANAVINAPPEPAASGQGWIASHIDRSEPSLPRAIWRQVPLDTLTPAVQPSATTTTNSAADIQALDSAVSTEAMAAVALALLLTRGKAKALARKQGQALLGQWVKQQGGAAEGRLGVAVETLLKKGEGFDAKAADRRQKRPER